MRKNRGVGDRGILEESLEDNHAVISRANSAYAQTTQIMFPSIMSSISTSAGIIHKFYIPSISEAACVFTDSVRAETGDEFPHLRDVSIRKGTVEHSSSTHSNVQVQ